METSTETAEKERIIEAGWTRLRIAAIPQEASDNQVRLMREAFFAGAQHLFAVMMNSEGPTETELERMELIFHELNDFMRDFKTRHTA